MVKRNTVLALGFAALAAAWWPPTAVASTINSSMNSTINSAINSAAPTEINFLALQGVRITLPDGSQVAFR
jgi:hypothetical protein